MTIAQRNAIIDALLDRLLLDDIEEMPPEKAKQALAAEGLNLEMPDAMKLFVSGEMNKATHIKQSDDAELVIPMKMHLILTSCAVFNRRLMSRCGSPPLMKPELARQRVYRISCVQTRKSQFGWFLHDVMQFVGDNAL